MMFRFELYVFVLDEEEMMDEEESEVGEKIGMGDKVHGLFGCVASTVNEMDTGRLYEGGE